MTTRTLIAGLALAAATALLPKMSPAASPAPDTITLGEAVDRAVALSRALPAQAAMQRAAEARADAALELPDPMLTLSSINIPTSGPEGFTLTEDFMTMTGVTVEQTWVRSSKRQARSAAQKAMAGLASARRARMQSDVRMATAQSWLGLHFIEREEALLRHERRTAEALREAVDLAFSNGQGRQAELLEARSRVAEVDDALLALAAERARIEAVLQVRLQMPIERIRLGGEPRFDTTSHPMLARDALALPAGYHPELREAEAEALLAQRQADVAQSDLKVDPTLELMFAKRGDAFTDMAGIAVKFPIQIRQDLRQAREVAAAMAEAEAAQDVRDEAARTHAAQVRAQIEDWRSALARSQHYQDRLVPLAREAARAARSDLQTGRGSLTEALAMQIQALRTERMAIDQQRTAALRWAQLEYQQ